MANSDQELNVLVRSILDGDADKAALLLAVSPQLAKARFQHGASRDTAEKHFLSQIKRYVFAGDTALHIAAAAYHAEITEMLLRSGADIHAVNRLGYNALHVAAAGVPGAHHWNPVRQSETIRLLIAAGTDANSTDRRGVTPLHIAVRTRCALAVQTLLECGADPARRNKSGSDVMLLAINSTGRGGSGSAEARAQREQILQLLRQAARSAKARLPRADQQWPPLVQ